NVLDFPYTVGARTGGPHASVAIRPPSPITAATTLDVTLSTSVPVVEVFKLQYSDAGAHVVAASNIAAVPRSDGRACTATAPVDAAKSDGSALWSWGAIAASGAYGFRIDAGETFQIALTAKPDLTIDAIRVSPVPPQLGDLVRVAATIRNGGRAA